MAVALNSPYQLGDDATYRVGIHIGVAAGTLLARFAPCPGLRHGVTHLLIFGDGLLQVVHRQTEMVDTLAVGFQVIRI
ncbi:MAG TPA: hypothetical protein VN176_18390 [Verrucomicrobiae bacterium]|nr:hypothetical protein [Verrucomicrobiae bacterium]